MLLPVGLPVLPGDIVPPFVHFLGRVARVPDGGDAVGALFLLDLQLAACWAPHNFPEMRETRLQALKLLGASPFCGTLPE